MYLSKKIIKKLKRKEADAPGEDYFELPEKVLQFGTGVLLRGLPDYFIDKANKQKIFNGRIVMVKSTESGATDAFEKQDCLYTLCIRGIEDGKNVAENKINASISRLLSAKKDWDEVLKCASNPDMQVVISNTTEVGLTLVKDSVHASPPKSFPGKLLAFLYQRYRIFQGDISKGMVIIPTELIPQNADKLLSIILELAHQNGLETAFLDWLENSNHFCNSLVDRIVPGKLDAADQREIELKSGYKDDLMIMSEVYRFWAIESTNEKVKQILSFSDADNGVAIAPDISAFCELKLRLLNGAHTFSCGLAHLAGFETVKEAMDDTSFSAFIKNLMLAEIAVAITDENISIKRATDFAKKVLERYRNPYINHHWLSITMQYTSKMRIRNIATLKNYIGRFKIIPSHMALGFAGYLLFMKPAEVAGNKYYGEANAGKYLINDDQAFYFHEVWKERDMDSLLAKVMSNQKLWGSDLSTIAGLTEAVKDNLNLLITQGAKKTIKNIEWDKKTLVNGA